VDGGGCACVRASAGTAAGAPCPRPRVSLLDTRGRSFSPVLPRDRLAGPRPYPACSQRAPAVPSTGSRKQPGARRDPSRTAREPTHQVRHTTGPGAERAPRSGEADDYADDDGDDDGDDDARLH